MTNTARASHRAQNAANESFAGTWTLLGFMLRRDRIWLPAWVLGLTALLAYFANALGLVLDEESLASFAALAANPLMALIGGPGYGFDEITVGRFLVGLYGAYLMIGAALMNIMTMSRHTRAEEQTGRAEIIRANVVGRHAQTAAALILVASMNLLVAVLMAVTFQTSPAEPGSWNSSFLFGLSVAALGMVFAGVETLTLQLSPYSRVGSGIAGAILAVSFIVRGFGDMSAVQGGNLDWLSWLSPFGWSQQTAPLTLDRWWPLLVSVGAIITCALVGFFLESRRDLAAGILPDRLGSATAAEWIRGPLTLVFRLQRASIAWWSFAMTIAGLIFGAFVQPMAENAEGMPPEILAVMGGAGSLVSGYIGFMSIYFAVMVAVFVLLTVQSLCGEEQGVRAEPILATSVSRSQWLLSWFAVAGLGALWLLTLAGLGNGLGAAVATGNWELFGQALLGQVAQTPAVWVLLGVAIALYAWIPRALGLVWMVFVYSTVLSFFGDMLQLSNAILATSVFRHIGQYPAEDISWAAVVTLVLIATALTAVGTLGFRRRDLVTA